MRHAWLCMLLVAACRTEPLAGGAGCVPGMSIACACSDGRTGAQTCIEPDQYGACQCTGSVDFGVPRDFGASDFGIPRDLARVDLRGADLAHGAFDFAHGPFDLAGVVGIAPSYGIDPAHTNAQPADSVASPLTKRWSVDLGGNASYPLIVGDTVFVAAAATQPNVRALDRATGALLWGPLVVGSSVLLAWDAGQLYLLNGSGVVTALDAGSGTQLWTTQLTGQIDFWSPPVAAGGYVYVDGLESGGTTYAIDGASGSVVWTANTFDGSDGTVAVADGVVFEAEACQQVSAFDAVSGTRLWYHSTSCTGGGGAAPSVYQGSIWVRDWALGNIVLDEGDGHPVGSFAADVMPALMNGRGYYRKASSLSAVDIASSTLLWTFTGDGSLNTVPVVAGGRGQVFVGSSSGNVYELDAATGAQISVAAAGAPVTASSETVAMALANGTLVVPAGHLLVAF